MKALILIIFMAGPAFAQCTAIVFNPLTGKFDCTGATGPAGPTGPAGATGPAGPTGTAPVPWCAAASACNTTIGASPFTVNAGTQGTLTSTTHGQGVYAKVACFTSATPEAASSCGYTRDTSGNVVITYTTTPGLIQIDSVGLGATGPTGPSGAGLPNATISHTFTGTQEVAFTHNLNTLNPLVACQDHSTPFTGISPGVNLVTPATVNITYLTATNITLDCSFNASGATGPTGPAGGVTSVFSRTGLVVAATNDYSFSQISGSLAAGQLPATAVTSAVALTSGQMVIGQGGQGVATTADLVDTTPGTSMTFNAPQVSIVNGSGGGATTFIRTNSAGGNGVVTLGSITGNGSGLWFTDGATAQTSANYIMSGGSTTFANTLINSPASSIAFRINNADVVRIAVTTGNLLVGGITDANYKLDVQKSGSVGTARFFDQTATTGATRIVGSLGAADTATTNIFSLAGSQNFLIGAGLVFKTGSNARLGSGTLVGGTLAVANTSITANSRVFIVDTTAGALTNVGSLVVVSKTAGVGFTVTSSNVLDTSTFDYWIHEGN